MPSFGPIGSMKNLMALVKEINFDEVRERAETPPRLLVVGTSQDAAERARDRLFGDDGDRFVDAVEADGSITDLGRYDAVIVTDPDHKGLADQVRREFPAVGRVAPVVSLVGDDERSLQRCRAALMSTNPELAPSIGRHLPACRKAAAKAVIDETSKANAQFAAVSNISSVVPIIGSLMAVGADVVILTKNQIMMVFKLAAVNGKDLHDQFRILREIIPVVGVGLFWRTVAREATSFIPFAAGTIPKVAIAYVGTMTLGRAADVYYTTGDKSTKEQMQSFKEQALESLQHLSLPGISSKSHEDELPESTKADTAPIDASYRDVGETAPLPNGHTEPISRNL